MSIRKCEVAVFLNHDFSAISSCRNCLLSGSLASGFSGDTTIGLVSENQALVKELTKNKTEDFSFKAVSSEKKAQEQLKDEKIDAYLLWTLQIIRFLVSFTLNAL